MRWLHRGEDERSWETFPDPKISSPTLRSMTSSGKTSKKRAAPSQISPRSKKTRSEKPHTEDEKPGAVKRRKPVTLLRSHNSDISSDEGENSSEEDAELADEDEEMPDVLTKDPNGGLRVYPLKPNAGLTVRALQLQGKHTKPRRFFLINASLQNLMQRCSETLSGYGALPDKKTFAQSGRDTSPIS